MAHGTLITLEGIDGAGKTTLAEGLRDALAACGVTVTLLREPGGVAAAEAIRELVRNPALAIGDRTEALLFAAARAQLVSERLGPLLADGAFVILDRFVDSSLVYQGAGRALGIEAVRAVNAFAIGDVTPARTLLLAIDPGLAASRARSRASASDRIEAEGVAFFAAIADAYAELAAAEPHRWRVLDATRTPDAMLTDGLAALSDLIDRRTQAV